MSLRSICGRSLTLVVLIAACGPAGEQAGEAEGEAMEEQPAQMQETMARPDTTGQGLWTYLQEANYRENWTHWPGKNPLYRGTEPHGMLLSTYVNDPALDALTNGAGALPHGAILVKENYTPDSTLAAVTVMYKAPAGYDPERNDWFWVKRNADGTFEAQGRAAGCQACHSQSQHDYVMTPLPGSSGMEGG